MQYASVRIYVRGRNGCFNKHDRNNTARIAIALFTRNSYHVIDDAYVKLYLLYSAN